MWMLWNSYLNILNANFKKRLPTWCATSMKRSIGMGMP